MSYLHFVHVKNTVCPSSADRSWSVAYDIRSLPHFGHFLSTTGPSSSSSCFAVFVLRLLTVLKWMVYSVSMVPTTGRNKWIIIVVVGLAAAGPPNITFRWICGGTSVACHAARVRQQWQNGTTIWTKSRCSFDLILEETHRRSPKEAECDVNKSTLYVVSSLLWTDQQQR